MQFINEHCMVNPTLEYAQERLKTIPAGTTNILSRGGGSTIDVGKWLAKELHLKHTVIPTTAGTGSEVTKYCVLVVNGKKQSFVDDAFIPTSYILNPAEVTSCPHLLSLSTGLDALSQALESLWSRDSTLESRAYSSTGFSLVMNTLGKSLNNRFDEKLRMDMLLAANFSGRAINIARTNVCHVISYSLTERYNIPHGIACAMSLKYFAKKMGGFDLEPFFKDIQLPIYPLIDPKLVAKDSIGHEKLSDCPFKVTEGDIIEALSW